MLKVWYCTLLVYVSLMDGMVRHMTNWHNNQWYHLKGNMTLVNADPVTQNDQLVENVPVREQRSKEGSLWDIAHQIW